MKAIYSIFSLEYRCVKTKQDGKGFPLINMYTGKRNKNKFLPNKKEGQQNRPTTSEKKTTKISVPFIANITLER